jgi:hypothetical protein
MALISRRGHRRRESPTPAPSLAPSLYPPGQSPLEQLPLEILHVLLLDSQNEQLVIVSKMIYARLGREACPWLFNKFYLEKRTKTAFE